MPALLQAIMLGAGLAPAFRGTVAIGSVTAIVLAGRYVVIAEGQFVMS